MHILVIEMDTRDIEINTLRMEVYILGLQHKHHATLSREITHTCV